MMRFFSEPSGLTVARICELVGAEHVQVVRPEQKIVAVSDLMHATADSIAALSSQHYSKDAAASGAAVMLTTAALLKHCGPEADLLVVDDPGSALAKISRLLYPDAAVPIPFFERRVSGISPAAHVHELAVIEDDVLIEPGAVIGAGVHIGEGTQIGSGAVIGLNSQIGRRCSIGPNVTVQHAIVGDDVILHPGSRIGQDGFGYSSSARGHEKIPQVGRAIIQDNVEIGANTCVDRGSVRDTVVGEGTRIDNQVQIAHNVIVGRHCVIVGGVSLAGSVTLGDFVVMGGHSVVNNHLSVGDGCQIAAVAVVNNDIPAGQTWSGVPAMPIKDHFREHVALKRFIQRDLLGKGKK